MGTLERGTPLGGSTVPDHPPATMEELPAYLGAFTNYERQGPLAPWRKVLGPERARLLLKELGLLPVAVPVVQVAGSKGKGSTVLWMEQLLLERGVRPGAFLSPHLERINERTRVAGCVIEDARLLDALTALHPTLRRIEAHDRHRMPTFFDLWIAVALWMFRRLEASPLLLEVGLGGPLDSTTAVPHDVGVLTSIDLEHRRELGETRTAIAVEKARIAREGKPFVVVEAESAWGRAALERARENGAVAIPCEHDQRVPPSVSAPQSLNSSAALRALEAGVVGSPFTRAEIEAAATALTLPARLEVLPGPPPLLLDVSHTPRSLELFCEQLQSFRGERPATVLFGLLEEKEWSEALNLLVAQGHPVRWIATRPDSPRALDPEHIATELRRRGASVAVVDAPHRALELLRNRARSGDAVAVTGSFYLAGAVRSAW